MLNCLEIDAIVKVPEISVAADCHAILGSGSCLDGSCAGECFKVKQLLLSLAEGFAGGKCGDLVKPGFEIVIPDKQRLQRCSVRVE